ncbi:MAG: repeat-containing protein, partial [Planctomycetaceae bacterium]|nr:repeat-containing protein [Planctomycetaceae bacterium]
WLGRYERGRELGRGGMGVVYQARDTQLGRSVAIKVLLAGPYANLTDLDRWRREAEAVACLAHPNIVQILEIGNHDGRPLIVLEYVAGRNLSELIAGQPQPAQFSAELLEKLSGAVHFAHQRGIVHRDLKPSNVLLATSENRDAVSLRQGNGETVRYEPKITDFGLAKRFVGDSSQTRTGALIGTPSYMAPEQTGVSKYVGPASDVYSLGAILYELLTGKPPFEAESVLETARQVVWDEPIPPSRLAPRVPRDLETICLKCLRKEPYKRYATADALADELRRYLTGQPILARPISIWQQTVRWAWRRPAIAALIAVSVVALTSVLMLNLWHTAELKKSNQRLTDALTETESERARAEREQAEAERQSERYREQLNRSQRGLFALQLAQVESLWRNDPGRGLVLLEDSSVCPVHLRDFTWRYLYGLCKRDRRVLAAPGRGLTWVALSPNGHQAAAIGTDHRVRIWKLDPAMILETEEPVEILAATTQLLLSAAWRDDQSLLLVEKNGATSSWDQASFGTRETIINGTTGAGCAAFTLTAKHLALGYASGEVKLYDLQSKKVQHTLAAHAGAVQSVAFSRDERWLVTCGTEGAICVWDVASGQRQIEITPRTDPALAVAFAPDGKLLATGHNDETVKLWQPSDGKLVATLKGHLSGVIALSFSHDGQTLASGSRDLSVRLWDVASRQPRTSLTGHAKAVTALDFSADDRTLISASLDGTARVWETVTPAPFVEWTGHRDRILALAFSPDGRMLASSSKDMTVKLWDRGTGQIRHTLERVHRVRRIVFTRDSKLMLTASEDRSVRLWDPATGKQLNMLTGHQGQVFGMDLAPDEQSIVTASDDHTLRLWDLPDRDVRASFGDQTDSTAVVVYSPDGKVVVSAGADHAIRVWDVATQKLLHTLTGHQGWVHGLAFSPDGTTLVSTSYDETARMWDTRSWKTREVLRGHTSYVMFATFSPDGQTLATGAGDRWSPVEGEVKLWDATTGHLRVTLHGQTGPVVFDPKSQYLATGSEQGVIRLWPAVQTK